MTATTLQQTRAAERPGYRLRHAARMEWIKLRSLRSTTWILAAGVVVTIALGTVAGLNTSDPKSDVTSNVLSGVIFGQLLLGVLGVLVMSSEYSSGTIRATLAAIPRRPLVLTGKAVVFGTVALVAGEVATFGSFLAGTAALRSSVPRPSLSDPAVLRAVVMAGAYLALIALIGLGIGAIVRHSAPAVTTLVGGLFVLPLVIGAGSRTAGQFMPELIVGNSLAAVQPVEGFGLSPWLELGIVALYAVVLLGVGRALLVRRDA
ncbi:ABC transporter permease [Catenulispora pinisilvae]|uniref:ABC transporter permease n=1 Tax=Catenulispora pinisilvae TaxID=2705253 RepID=UPI0018922114|nr:ABC transporter permease [Catenulispora pinisilvae]